MYLYTPKALLGSSHQTSSKGNWRGREMFHRLTYIIQKGDTVGECFTFQFKIKIHPVRNHWFDQ